MNTIEIGRADEMVLVYQAYGRDDVMAQTFFSVTTLLAQINPQDELDIWIYTDRPEQVRQYFAGYIDNGGTERVRVVAIDQNQLKAWRGDIDFVHRVKIEILHDAGQQFQGPLFYVDGDTYFRASPLELFAKVNDQNSLMHVAEGVIARGRDPLSKKLAKFLRQNEFVVDGQSLRISPDLTMWNAGLIGVSEAQKKSFQPILALTDVLYLRYPKHVQEQLAVSYVLQKCSTVLAADHIVGHYWDQKPAYQKAIGEFLQKYSTIDQGLKHLGQFVHPHRHEPSPKDGRNRFFRKMFQSMFSVSR